MILTWLFAKRAKNMTILILYNNVGEFLSDAIFSLTKREKNAIVSLKKRMKGIHFRFVRHRKELKSYVQK
jgi:hypothetical protein